MNQRMTKCLLVLSMLGFTLLPRLVLAQAKEYRVLEPARALFILPDDPSDVQRSKKDKIRNVQTQVQDVLQGKVALAERQTVVENWYVNYIFPKITLYTPDALAELSKERDLFNKVMAEYATDATAHEFVVSLALKELVKIVNDDFHPAVRYNAMLMITDLNKVEMNRKGETPTPAEIYVPALQFMLKVLEDKDSVEYLRIAALIGLVRHTSSEVYNFRAKSQSTTYRIPNADWDRIRKITLGIVRNEKAGTGEDSQGHQWVRRRAMEILGWMAAARPEPEIVKEMVARVSNPKESRGVRCEATVGIGNMLVTGPIAVKPLEIANSVGQFIADAVEEDITRLTNLKAESEEFKNIHSADAAGTPGPAELGLGGVGPGVRGGLIDPYDFRIDPTRRRLKHEIGCALYALTGMRELKRSAIEPTFGLLALYKPKADDKEPRNPKDKETINAIAKLLDEVAKSTTGEDTRRYIKDTEAAAVKLREKVLGAAAPAAAILEEPKEAAPAPEAPPAKKKPDPAADLSPE